MAKKKLNLKNNYLLLVNKDNKLPCDYVPSNLVIVDENENNFRGYADANLKPMVDEIVLDAFMKLQKDALKEEYDFVICSGYRSYEYQQVIYDRIKEKQGEEYARKYVALPGASEHQSGLAIDICAFHDGVYSDDLTLEEINWLKDNAYKFGFILRYPLGKEDITGYNYEPWHYRYIGLLAKTLYENNLTLEEYYLNKEVNGKIDSKK